METKPRKAIAVSRWSDMARFGIEVQFRDKCPFGVRNSFALNAAGCELLKEYWGLTDAKFEPGAPGVTVNGEPAVAHVYLAHSELMPLAEFALFRMQPVGLALRDGIIKGIFDQELYDSLRTTHTLKFNNVRHSLHRTGNN